MSLASTLVNFGAPLLADLIPLPIPGKSAIITSLARSFLLDDDADEEAIAAKIEADPNAAMKLKQFEMAHEEKLVGLRLQHAQVEMQERTKRLAEVNATIRAEAQSGDKYVARWRPTFGYCVAFTWTVVVLGLIGGTIFAIIKETTQAAIIIQAIGGLVTSMTVMWTMALSILGVSVWQRSSDKKVLAGQPTGLAALISSIKG